jgi:hypothetical protein
MRIDVPRDIVDEEEALKYIKKYIKCNLKDGPVKSYYLQCAWWRKSYYRGPNSWIAECDYDPIYGLDDGDISYSDSTEIAFSSWKGNHDDVTIRYAPRGNLPFDGMRCDFTGNIWTRGE